MPAAARAHPGTMVSRLRATAVTLSGQQRRRRSHGVPPAVYRRTGRGPDVIVAIGRG